VNETVQLCAFRVGKHDYVLDIMRVEEVLISPRPTALPDGSSVVHGVVSLRGQVLPVIDVRKHLGVEPEALGRLLVCRVGPRRLGLIVDRVTQVLRVPRSELKAAPGGPPTPKYPVLGVCQAGERLLLMLDVKSLLQPLGN
jgi:purine-binding chemotaxis protein CheW